MADRIGTAYAIACRGVRVQLHPAMDAWMQGDRFGTIEQAGRYLFHVRLERSRRLAKLSPDDVTRADGTGDGWSLVAGVSPVNNGSYWA